MLKSGVTIDIQRTATPETDGYAFDTAIRTATSDETGLVGVYRLGGLVQPIRCRLQRHSGTLTVPNYAAALRFRRF